jgi:hypothetical protein
MGYLIIIGNFNSPEVDRMSVRSTRRARPGGWGRRRDDNVALSAPRRWPGCSIPVTTESEVGPSTAARAASGAHESIGLIVR